jgi:hypothetical protein
MREYSEYVERMRSLVNRSTDGRCRNVPTDEILAALDGQPSRELVRLVKPEALQQSGVFFSGSQIAAQLAAYLKGEVNLRSRITDPACGVGDLLLACAHQLGRGKSLEETLARWGLSLFGCDLYEEFIALARLRLVLKAIHPDTARNRLSDLRVSALLPGLSVGNGLDNACLIKQTTHIITNPPFTMVSAGPNCTWASGLVNHSALFLEYICAHSEPGTRILAVLPDVLRSGSRYERWRQLIAQRCDRLEIKLMGQFSPDADVHVFLLNATRKDSTRTNTAFWCHNQRSQTNSIGSYFDVCVGPVVPHRHINKGRYVPYLSTGNCPRWGVVSNVTAKRRFAGRLLKPPFVAIRRTSRPEEPYRAVGTIVRGTKAVAVENHLIVALPYSRTLRDCTALISVLKMPRTSRWLNKHIRCRHLTTTAVSSVPWVETSE